jgi:predicted transcriptional regulator YheO
MFNLPFDPYHFTLILIALISGVISPVIVQLTKYYISILRLPPKKHEVGKALKYEDLITHKLEKIKQITNSDRVWILEFHNGNYTFTGKGLQKFSVTYEVVNPGIAREGVTTQSIPTSLFSRFFKSINDFNIFKVENVNNVNESNSSLQSFFESRGTKSFYAVGIRNIENLIVGVLCIETITNSLTLSPEDISNIKSDANILAGYLETIN